MEGLGVRGEGRGMALTRFALWHAACYNPTDMNMRIPAVVLALCGAGACLALSPDDVIVVANSRVPASRAIAAAYCDAHGISSNRVVFVDVEDRSDMTSEAYRRRIEAPVLAAVTQAAARCVVLCYGIPWRIVNGRRDTPPHPSTSTWASVDTELATLGKSGTAGLPASPNPYFGQSAPFARNDMLLVARLDGANARDAQALIVRAEAVEATAGGCAMIDQQPVVNNGSNGVIRAYNMALERAAAWLESQGISVILDAGQELATPPANRPVLLYWGWYAGPNGDYTSNTYAGCEWAFGAVAVHVCSFGAAGMRRTQSAVPGLVADGVSATIGSVHEPLVQGWTVPDVFCVNYFRRDGSGLTFIESAYAATPFLSWQMLFIGDPLLRYRPYSARQPVASTQAER